jgi:hypothetical protein
MLATGDELASAASKALGHELKFEDISEYVKENPPRLSNHKYKAWANDSCNFQVRSEESTSVPVS